MDKKIKIGFITERMLLGFGVDRVIHKTANELVDQGFDVSVFCIFSDGAYENERYKIIRLAVNLDKNPIKSEFRAVKALKRLNCEDIDVWIVETYPFFIASRILNKPVIVVDHGVSSSEGFKLKLKLIFEYMKFTQNFLYFPAAAKIINISKFTQSLTPHLLRNKQEIIFNGVDNYDTVSSQQITKFKEKHTIKDSDIVLAYVGRLNHDLQPYKGTRELVATYKKLLTKHPNLKLIMAGLGNKEDKKWLIGEGVIPIINATDIEISTIYAIADVYVTASKWEGFNLPLIEAGLFRTPAVAYNAGAHKEVLLNNAGFLVENNDEFHDKIDLLIRDKATRDEMAENAFKNSSQFTWKRAGSEYAKIISEVLPVAIPIVKQYEEGLVDVITLNYNGKRYLEALFDSLKKQTYKNIRVTMVDNGSSDDSIAFVKEKFPWVNVIASKENLFFSRGNNLAISQTNGEYLFLVNNDTIVQDDAVEKMVQTMLDKGKYNAAAISAKMLFYKNRKLIDAIGTVITNNGSPFNRGIGQIDIGQYDEVEEVFGACFGAVLLRRTVYANTVGPLDNSYFGYFEDVDWCFRARIMGYKIYSCPQAVVFHDHSGSSKLLDYNWKYYLIHRNFIRTIIKNFQLKKAVTKSIWKIIGLIKDLRIPQEPGRKMIILRILGNTSLYLPILLAKRFKIQSRRSRADHDCLKFQTSEAPAFDPVKYEPLLTLNTLQLMFSKLDAIRKYEDEKVSAIISKINYLNSTKSVMDEKIWDKKTTELIRSLESFIGVEYADKFIRSIVTDKI